MHQTSAQTGCASQARTIPNDRFTDIAEAADETVFLLSEGCPVEDIADLNDLARELMTLEVDPDHQESLARSIRCGLDGVGLWMHATAAACQMTLAGQAPSEITERLEAVSLAWRWLPAHEPTALHATNEALLASGAGLLSVELA